VKILGLVCPVLWSPNPHDAAAAILIDGRIVAAAEEERFTRIKHAKGQVPIHATRFCLDRAGIAAKDIDAIAFNLAPASYRRHGWSIFWRDVWRRPRRALKRLRKDLREATKAAELHRHVVAGCGLDPRTEVIPVDHHAAHAASSFIFSGFPDAAYLVADNTGEVATTTLGEARGATLDPIVEILRPNSLGQYYSVVTDYLGFEPSDGEYKVMGMAPYGDASGADAGVLLRYADGAFEIDRRICFPRPHERYDGDRWFSKRLVDLWGPPRRGDDMEPRHANIAAAAQAQLEKAVHHLVDAHLGPVLKRCGGRLCFAGGVALNVTLNRKLLDRGDVKRLFVQPAADDAGTSLGAAGLVAAARGERVEPMTHAYLGPSFGDDDVRRAIEKHGGEVKHRFLGSEDETVRTAADLLAAGKVVAWLQGRMEFGPRALGNRSILGHPGRAGTRDEINAAIKFREPWRPFCPSVLAEDARAVIGSDHPTPFMNLSFLVSEEWKTKIPEVVHVDGSARPQAVTPEANKLYYELIRAFKERTGIPVLLNTSLNRRGEPIVCSPADGLTMFYGSGLERLVMGNCLVEK